MMNSYRINHLSICFIVAVIVTSIVITVFIIVFGIIITIIISSSSSSSSSSPFQPSPAPSPSLSLPLDLLSLSSLLLSLSSLSFNYIRVRLILTGKQLQIAGYHHLLKGQECQISPDEAWRMGVKKYSGRELNSHVFKLDLVTRCEKSLCKHYDLLQG